MASTGGTCSAKSPDRTARTGGNPERGGAGAGGWTAAAALFLFAALPFAAGCPYGFSTALPSHIKSIAVPVFANRTLEFNLEQEVTTKVVERFVQNNRLRVVPEKEADATLVGEILEYNKSVTGFNREEEAQEYLITIVASLMLKDRVRNKELWRADRMTGSATYYIEATAGQEVQTETQGREAAVEEIARQALARTVEGW
jgi:outer membrane lipopolysaccharide assembly protein LptE/RlpB